MEYINGGDLFTHLRKEGNFKPKRSKFYAAQILLAIEYMHMMGIIYRDLKPENVLIDGQGHIKIIDFGLSSFEEIKRGGGTKSSFDSNFGQQSSVFSNNILTMSQNS